MSAWTLDLDCASRGVQVTLNVAKGERIALVGPNGAGKSTILAALAGHLRRGAHDSLDVKIGGKNVTNASVGHRDVVYLSQRANVFDHMSVLDNVAYGPRAHGMSKAKACEKALGLLDEVGLAHLAARKGSELSGGEAQRCALARALAIEPSVVLLDEPLAALDIRAAEELREVINRLVGDRTLVFVSHDPLDVASWATRIVELGEGRVVSDSALGSVRSSIPSPFMCSLFSLAQVRGIREASGDFVSDAGVRLASATSEIYGPAQALVDPRKLVIEPDPEGILPGPLTRIGQLSVRFVGDVPVQASAVEMLGGMSVLSVTYRVRAVAPVEVYPA